MTTPSAASFIDQIKAEYREVVKAESGALPHAIKCGEFLNLAKENLKAEKGGKWSEWRETNCSEISQETASLYMRLAENKKLVMGKAKSIREADETIRKTKAKTRTTTTPAPRDANEPGGGFVHEKPAPKLEDELETLAPDEVCKMLVDSWDDEQLRRLTHLLNEHLKRVEAATATMAKPTISNTVTNPANPAASLAERRA